MPRKIRTAIAMVASTVLLGAVLASPTSATPRWTWDADFGGWMDEECDGTPVFQLIVYGLDNYQGAKAKICDDTGNLANVPRGGSGTSDNFNNKIRSYWAKAVPANKRIWFYQFTGYDTPFDYSVGGYGDLYDDYASSINLGN